MAEICAVGGYDAVGANMTAVRIDDEVIICDMGISVENYIQHTNDGDLFDFSVRRLISSGSVPDIGIIDDWRKDVKAIVISHAHLDHCAAVPFLAKKFDCPVLCTPFTAAIIKTILRDDKIKLPNKLITVSPNSRYNISQNFEIEFINVTHSTPQAALIALHTPEGTFMYANDFKLDKSPYVGKKTNTKRLKELKNVKCLIIDTLGAGKDGKTASESIAREMLRDALSDIDCRALVVSTFSSHIARLKTLMQIAKELNRKVVLLGRSLAKYVEAAEEVNLVNFTKDSELVKYRRNINKRLRELSKEGLDDKMLIVTGHQGEPKAVLSRIAKEKVGLKLGVDDAVVFSCTVIPTEMNIDNRERLEEELREKGVRIFKDLHVSGHASREDIREIISMLNPEHLIPAHGGEDITTRLNDLAKHLGYEKEKNYHIMKNGKRIII